MEDRREALDYIDGIQVSADDHNNNLSVLRSPDIGVFCLAGLVRQCEVEFLERYGN